jgi:hypothetical protein
MSAPPVYQQARAETAAMLGYDLASLTAEQATRLDVAAALRLAVDDQSGKLARGETTDVTKLLSASEALARLLPPLREPPPANRVDPRKIMLDTYMAMRRRGELADPTSTYEGMKAEVERLQAENEQLKAQLAERYAASVPPPPDNVVKLSPRGDNSSPPPAKSTPPAPATGGLLTDDTPEPWRPFVGGGSRRDPWADNRT